MQKYLHISEPFAVSCKNVMFLLPMNFLTSSGIYSNLKLSKYAILSPYT